MVLTLNAALLSLYVFLQNRKTDALQQICLMNFWQSYRNESEFQEIITNQSINQ